MIHRPILAVALAVSVLLCNSALCQDLKSQALDHFKNESYTEAIEALNLALTQHPEDAQLWFYLGWFTHYYCYDSVPFAGFAKAVSDSILVYLKKALSLDPTLRDAYSFLGSEYGARALYELQLKNVAGFLSELKLGGNAGSYPGWLLEYARNILRSCGENAILITGGDAEAFPIWYCQFVEEFRRDVTGVPFALLERPWFVLLLKNGVPGFFAPTQVPWSEQQITDMHPYKWKAQIVDIQPPSSITDAVRFHIKPDLTSADRELLSTHRALLLDMIKVNRWQRPVQFTLGCPSLCYHGH